MQAPDTIIGYRRFHLQWQWIRWRQIFHWVQSRWVWIFLSWDPRVSCVRTGCYGSPPRNYQHCPHLVKRHNSTSFKCGWKIVDQITGILPDIYKLPVSLWANQKPELKALPNRICFVGNLEQICQLTWLPLWSRISSRKLWTSCWAGKLGIVGVHSFNF